MSQISENIELDSSIPRLGNRFSQWIGTTVLKCMGWKIVGEFPKVPKMVIAVAPTHQIGIS